MKLALGTVQFGMAYGAFNTQGALGLDDVAACLDLAHSKGIKVLDTARLYGEAEQRLGQLNAPSRFRIVSKCPGLPEDESAGSQLLQAFDASLAALQTETIHGYMLHRADDLLKAGGSSIWKALQSLRASGKVQKIGVSAYDMDTVRQIAARFDIDLAQLPANALTPWIYDTQIIEELSQQSVEIHVRSAFLQGFLLSDPDKLPAYLTPWRPQLEHFRSRAAERNLAPLSLALAIVLANPAVSQVVIGVNNQQQLAEILNAVSSKTVDLRELANLAVGDARLTDPRLWKM